MDAVELSDRVPLLDERSMADAYALVPATERGRLGKLEGLAIWLAGVQARCPAQPLVRKRLVHFGDPLPDTAPVAVLAAGSGVGIRMVTRPPSPPTAFAQGLALADTEVDEGADLLLTGYAGADERSAAALVCTFTDAEPVEVVSRSAAWSRDVAVVRDQLRLTGARSLAPLDALAAVADPGVGMLAGFLLGAATRRTPVVVDGVVAAAAALAVARIVPHALAYFVAAHAGTEPAAARAYTTLGLDPLLDLGVRAGDGLAALLAVPILDAAVALADVRR